MATFREGLPVGDEFTVGPFPVDARAWAGANLTKVTSWVPVSEEFMVDLGWFPWRRPDPAPHFTLVLFPRLSTAAEWLGEARVRVLLAARVLRHGPPESASWDEDD